MHHNDDGLICTTIALGESFDPYFEDNFGI